MKKYNQNYTSICKQLNKYMLNDNLLRFSNLLENNITNNNHIHSATQDKQDKQKKQTIEKKRLLYY